MAARHELTSPGRERSSAAPANAIAIPDLPANGGKAVTAGGGTRRVADVGILATIGVLQLAWISLLVYLALRLL
jgi:hypothetical protein